MVLAALSLGAGAPRCCIKSSGSSSWNSSSALPRSRSPFCSGLSWPACAWEVCSFQPQSRPATTRCASRRPRVRHRRARPRRARGCRLSRVPIVGRGIPGIMLRGLVATICLLPPTVLMGALPAMGRWLKPTPSAPSQLGVNTHQHGRRRRRCLLAGFSASSLRSRGDDLCRLNIALAVVAIGAPVVVLAPETSPPSVRAGLELSPPPRTCTAAWRDVASRVGFERFPRQPPGPIPLAVHVAIGLSQRIGARGG